MQDTDATISTSLRVSRLVVAAWRRRSMSSLTTASFSMYVSDCGRYASGW